MLVDYHTHHYRCGHATGTLDEIVQAAIEAGLDEIGLSDHSPIVHFGDDPQPFPGTAMHVDEFPRYVEDMQRVKEEYADRITVRLGVESDYVSGWEDHYRHMWQKYSLDYVIGSVHWLGQWSVFWRELPEGKTLEEIQKEYFLTVQAAARSGIFDIIGHLDVPKTNGHMTGEVTELVKQTLHVIAEADVAIELNTSGWRKEVNECFPSEDILRYAAKLDIPITLGSDAHSPDVVAAGFDRALSLLHDCGFTRFAIFENRQRKIIPLPSLRGCHTVL